MPVVYRDEVTLVSLKGIRTQVTPRAFKEMTSVTLEHDGVRCKVGFVSVVGHDKVSRRFFKCPGCGTPATVLGAFDGKWRGRCCVPWRHRAVCNGMRLLLP